MIEIGAPHTSIHSSLHITGSKSLSNRLLVIKQLYCPDLSFSNLSDSEDTQLLSKALKIISTQQSATIDVNHAGTDMRFLTALLAVSEGDWILSGSSRLKERPIAELVNVLRFLGADITYLEKENFPPLGIKGKKLRGGTVEINAGISSQFISALLLVASRFTNGLDLHLKGNVVSKPYIKMTTALLKDFGIDVTESENNIRVLAMSNTSVLKNKHIESDWSSASYYYSICALSKNAQMELSHFEERSLQADSILPLLFKDLGVKTESKNGTIVLTSIPLKAKEFAYDCTDCPDIAQTLVLTCFGLGIGCTLTGLSTLKLKESDRILALKTELEKLGAMVDVGLDFIRIIPETGDKIQETRVKIQETRVKSQKTIETYNDHRMAMSFAPLALKFGKLFIRNPSVVNKSYPGFWEDLKSLGFNVNLQP